MPSITGKLELEYEGELKGADQVARDLVRSAVSHVFDGYVRDSDLKPVIDSSYPLEQLADAFRHQESQRHFGKICVTVQ